MREEFLQELFGLKNKVVMVTGGGGVLARSMAYALASAGARLVLIDRSEDSAVETIRLIEEVEGEVLSLQGDVLKPETLEVALAGTVKKWGQVDVLINAAGGNQQKATTSKDLSFFNLPAEALKAVVDLNLLGTIYPSQVIGKHMAERGEGVIVNVSSMNSFRPLTRIIGYSAAKAAINNFTQWLAVHLATEYSSQIRVNAIAPGFFETKQNRFLLRNEDGSLTERGQLIVDHTPQSRFGHPDDLVGTVLWLVSPASSFVTGSVIPIDGGFSAYSGV